MVRNTLGVLAVLGAHDVPVAPGAARPLLRRLTTATFFHGQDGIGGIPLPALTSRPADESGADHALPPGAGARRANCTWWRSAP